VSAPAITLMQNTAIRVFDSSRINPLRRQKTLTAKVNWQALLRRSAKTLKECPQRSQILLDASIFEWEHSRWWIQQ
jgi:hypothetical protein